MFPKSYKFYITEIILTIAREFKISPFEIMQSDFDDFAMLVNYYFNNDTSGAPAREQNPKKEARIKVDDNTASGGWF